MCLSIAMYTRMLKKVPGVTECYGWWNSMAFTKSQTNHFSADEKTEIPGKPNSVVSKERTKGWMVIFASTSHYFYHLSNRSMEFSTMKMRLPLWHIDFCYSGVLVIFKIIGWYIPYICFIWQCNLFLLLSGQEGRLTSKQAMHAR